MLNFKKGCVVRGKALPEVRVWIVGTTFEDDAYTGIALAHYPLICHTGDMYTIRKGCAHDFWEITDEFYDVAEVVTKMQEVKNNG